MFSLLLFYFILISRCTAFIIIPESIKYSKNCWTSFKYSEFQSKSSASTSASSNTNSRSFVAQRMRKSNILIDETDAGSLWIQIPAVGIKADNLFEIGFTATWLGLVGQMTVRSFAAGAVGPVGSLIFIPFWLAGAQLTKKTAIDPLTDIDLTIGVYAWSLSKKVLGKIVKVTEGPTWELEAAEVSSDIEVNGKALTCVQLSVGGKIESFGNSLSEKEKEWLVQEINNWLYKNKDEICNAADSF